MFVLIALKRSIKPISYLILILIFFAISFFSSSFLSMNFSGEKADPLSFYLNFIHNKNFFGENFYFRDFLNFSDFKLVEFLKSQLGFLFFITFLSVFILYHLFLPLIYKNLKGEKITFIFKNSLFVLISGFIQIFLYSFMLYFFIYLQGKLKNFSDTMILETYKIASHFLLNLAFILFFLFFRYFFSFLKVSLSLENFSFMILKDSVLLSFKNYLKLSIFHLILFGINYFLLHLFGGNLINVFFKAYFFLLSLSYYLTLREGK